MSNHQEITNQNEGQKISLKDAFIHANNHAAGCITTANVADDIMISLNSSDKLALQFILLGNRAANVNLDLDGFSDVYASMVIEQGKLNKEFVNKKAE